MADFAVAILKAQSPMGPDWVAADLFLAHAAAMTAAVARQQQCGLAQQLQSILGEVWHQC